MPLRRPSSRTIIYEMHVRGFTRHPSSGVSERTRGTYAGLIEKIPYLQQLGITAVELLPVFQFDAQDAPAGLVNYWGYAPVSFFAPHQGYSSRPDPLGPINEFRDMVKALHRAGIEVGVARTLPPHGETPGVHEVERLYLDMIAAARNTIYIENQYFTAPRIAAALCHRSSGFRVSAVMTIESTSSGMPGASDDGGGISSSRTRRSVSGSNAITTVRSRRPRASTSASVFSSIPG